MHEVTGRPRVALVMLSYNGGEKTLATLQSLFDAGEEASVLVWDNGSRDATAAEVESRFPHVLVHRHPTNLGVASGRNAAAALAIERFAPSHLLFLDDDMLVQPGFVAGLLAPFLRDPSVGQTQAKLKFLHDPSRLNDGGGCRIRFWLGSTTPVGFGEVDRGQYDTPHDCIACGGAMMVRTELFQQLGGFDAVFNPFGPEDLDFSLRLQKAGFRAVYSPSAVAHHAVSGTFEGGKQAPIYTQKRIAHWLRFLRRHASGGEQMAFFFLGLPYRAGRMGMRAIRSGDAGVLRGVWAFVASLGRPKQFSAANHEADVMEPNS
jgi:GT2 family glycosyltransferase